MREENDWGRFGGGNFWRICGEFVENFWRIFFKKNEKEGKNRSNIKSAGRERIEI